ncbi:Pentapeptide repeats (8 copies) [compost metagenome]
MGINFSECIDFLFSVSFQNCILDYSSFEGKKMVKTTFADCSLKGAVFANTDLKGSKFDNCNLDSAQFERTNLREANLSTAINYAIDPELNDIKKARFSIHGIPGLLNKYDIKIEQ